MNRALVALLTSALVLVAGLVLVVVPPGGPPPTYAATRVDKERCRDIDPNLVRGACLRVAGGLTWIGSYRAPDGRIFFCIDYLYDSRLPRHAATIGTQRLVNQLGHRVGDAEVAALNAVISTWAAAGSTGSDDRDAAIALVVREVMGDGVRTDGTVVYPPGLDVGERVRAPHGGLEGRVLRLAREMWSRASRHRGPYELRMDSRNQGPMRLGRTRTYRVRVLSAAGVRVPGVEVRFRCTGPIRCPRPRTSTAHRIKLRVKPHDVGRYRIRAVATGPAGDGFLYRAHGWRTHGGRTARPAGIQRGWIARASRASAEVGASARVRRARPVITTRTSHGQAHPGVALHDEVSVTGLPEQYDATVTATLHGPFATAPGPGDCTPSTALGSVVVPVAGDGTVRTPTVVAGAVGFHTWVVDLPGDETTLPVTTPCGVLEETTQVVPRQPRVTTVASEQHALTGARVFDTVRVRGLDEGDRVTVRWWLHGPVAPRRDGSCDRLPATSWQRAPVADRGEMSVGGDGDHRTRATRVDAPGCYTYREELPATATTAPAATLPGVPVETALVTRPVTPYVPEVPSGPATLGPARTGPPVGTAALLGADAVAPGDREVTVPTRRAAPRYLQRPYREPAASARARRVAAGRLVLPRLGIDARVARVGLDRGALAVPDDRRLLGWLGTTAAAGDLIGSSVVSGHVSDRRDTPGALWRLRGARVGDLLTWTSASGRVHRYVVRGVARHPRRGGLPARLFRTDGPRLLHLVTCASRRTTAGGFHYVDNLVVTAEEVRRRLVPRAIVEGDERRATAAGRAGPDAGTAGQPAG